jgi:hypothetical protein
VPCPIAAAVVGITRATQRPPNALAMSRDFHPGGDGDDHRIGVQPGAPSRRRLAPHLRLDGQHHGPRLRQFGVRRVEHARRPPRGQHGRARLRIAA